MELPASEGVHTHRRIQDRVVPLQLIAQLRDVSGASEEAHWNMVSSIQLSSLVSASTPALVQLVDRPRNEFQNNHQKWRLIHYYHNYIHLQLSKEFAMEKRKDSNRNILKVIKL